MKFTEEENSFTLSDFKSINKYSIGIEIQNPGHFYSYEKFSIKQINSLKELIKKLIKIYY